LRNGGRGTRAGHRRAGMGARRRDRRTNTGNRCAWTRAFRGLCRTRACHRWRKIFLSHIWFFHSLTFPCLKFISQPRLPNLCNIPIIRDSAKRSGTFLFAARRHPAPRGRLPPTLSCIKLINKLIMSHEYDCSVTQSRLAGLMVKGACRGKGHRPGVIGAVD